MLKFTVNMKDLKSIIDKVSMVVDRKTLVPALRKCYFQVTDCQRLRMYATDYNHFLEMNCETVHGAQCGRVGIDVDDLKTITKMTGDISITETLANGKPLVTVKNQKKCILLPAYLEEGIDWPEMKNAKPILQMDSSWFLETISKLSCFTIEDTANPVAGSICLNARTKQAEALDGNHAGVRKFPDKTFIHQNEEVKLPNRSFPVLKTLLNKKTGEWILIFKDEKYVEIAMAGFCYIIRETEGGFFDVKRMLMDAACHNSYRITVNKEDFIKVVQYGNSLVKKIGCRLFCMKQKGIFFRI